MMNAKTFNLQRCGLLLFLTFPLFLISCNSFDDDCPDHKYSKVKVSSFETGTYSYLFPPNEYYVDLDTANDSVEYFKFAISIRPVYEYYAFSTCTGSSSNPFWNSAYACSPPVPQGSPERIESISITADTAYDAAHPAGSELNMLFDAIFRTTSSGYVRKDLNSFVAEQPTVAEHLLLVPKSSPDASKDIQFTVDYRQDGVDLDQYNFSIEKVYLRK